MRKALNFDLDTKKYEEFTHRPAPTAYAEIRRFLKKMISSIDKALAIFQRNL